MKKRNVFLLGLLVILLAMGLVWAGCDNGSGNNSGGQNSGGQNSGGQNSGGQDNGGQNSGGQNSGGGQVPGYVQGITVTGQSDSSIKVSWNAVSGATSYEVWGEKGSKSNESKSSGATQLGGTITDTSYTHSGLPASTPYTYWIRAVNSAGPGGFQFGKTGKTNWGGGSLTVTGYRQGVNSTIGIFVLTSNPSTYQDFYAIYDADTYEVLFTANPTSNDKYDWQGGDSAPPDGTYTIVISTGGIGFSLSSTQVYKFTNITVTGGTATVPFNTVLGSVVGTNGRLK
jgi:hypothetical protein